jgi:hypothetical protein
MKIQPHNLEKSGAKKEVAQNLFPVEFFKKLPQCSKRRFSISAMKHPPN